MSNNVLGDVLFGIVVVVAIGLFVILVSYVYDKMSHAHSDENISNLDLLEEYDYLLSIYDEATYMRYSGELIRAKNRLDNLRETCLKAMCDKTGDRMTGWILRKSSELNSKYGNLIDVQSKYKPSSEELDEYWNNNSNYSYN